MKKKPELLEKIKNLNKSNVKTCFIIFSIVSILLFVALSQTFIYFLSTVVSHYEFIIKLNIETSKILRDTVKMKATMSDILLHKSGRPTSDFTDTEAL
jgi:hypothetical protein